MTLILSGTDGLSDVDGSAATPAIRGTDANTGIFFGADIIGFAEGGAEVARFDSAGNFGLGVTPSAWANYSAFQIGAQSSLVGNASFAILSQNWRFDGSDKYIATAAASQYYQGSGAHVWRTAASGTAGNTISFTQAMTLDASGNLGIGTTSPVGRFTAQNTDNSTVAVFCGESGGTARGLRIATGIQAGVTSNNELAILDAQSNAGVPTMVFQTAGTERARITSGGNLLVGLTSNGAAGAKFTIYAATGQEVLLTGASGTCIKFTNSQDLGGAISVASGGGTTYGTSSDYRLKHDIQPMTGALAKVAQLNPVTYKWNVDESESQGFIAHELQAIIPDAVVGEKDAVDADGNPQYQNVDTSFLVATLTAAIQEQQALIQTLTDRITALETPTGTQA